MAALTQELQQAINGPITDVIGGWFAAQYAGSVNGELAAAEGSRRLEILRACIQDWAKLRRGDHTAARMEHDRKQLDWQRAKSEAKKEKEFREWLKRPEIIQELFPKSQARLSEETKS